MSLLYDCRVSFVVAFIVFTLFTFPSLCLENFTFTAVGDVHYDPFFNEKADPKQFCRGGVVLKGSMPFSIPGCDSSIALVDGYFQAASDLAHDARYVFVMGDLPAHDLPTDKNHEAYRYVVKKLLETWPGARFFPVLGNNDVSTDYCVYENSSDYARIRKEWGSHFPGGADAAASWDKGGYYSVEIENTGLMVIALNTVFYSSSVGRQPCPIKQAYHEGDPAGQAAWFETQVREAKKRGLDVWVLAHVPASISPHTSSNSFTAFGQRLWDTHFSPFLRSYGPVTAAFFGHRHFDESVVLGVNGPDGIPGFITPSVTPVFTNNPGIRVLQAVRPHHWVVGDYSQYFSSIWKANSGRSLTWASDYTFSTAYSSFMVKERTATGSFVKYIDASSILKISDTMSDVYRGMGSIDLVQQIMGRIRLHFDDSMLSYACSLQERDEDGFLHCVSPPGSMNLIGSGIPNES